MDRGGSGVDIANEKKRINFALSVGAVIATFIMVVITWRYRNRQKYFG